jgi:uncharacterized membrane protein
VRRDRRSEGHERGAIAVFVAAIMAVVVGMAAFAVDLGMQRVVRADMQAVADVVALDAARLLDGRTAAEIVTGGAGIASLDQVVQTSAGRNSEALGAEPSISATLVYLDIDEHGRQVPRRDALGQLVPVEDSDVPDGVVVTSAGSVDFAFAPGSGAATRDAVAATSAFACYKLGSWAALLDTGQSPLLNPVLGKMAQQSGAFANGGQVCALTYSGLAYTKVALGDLAAALGVGSADQLAGATVSLRSFYTALHALATPRNSTAIAVLDSLRLNASATRTLDVGRLLAADLGGAAAVGASANVLDLVGGTISLLNGVNTANVYVGATLPSLSSAGVEVRLTQGPRQYCGRPGSDDTVGLSSDTEQLYVRVGGQLAPTNVDFAQPPILGLLSNVVSARITAENYVTFDLRVAGTSSRLTGVHCGAAQGIELDVENGLVTVTMETPLRGEVRASLAGGLFGGLLDAVISFDAGVKVTAQIGQSGRADMEVHVPPLSFDRPYPTSSGGVTITSVTRTWGNVSAHVRLLSGLLGAGISLTSTERATLLDSILTAGLSQLFSPTDPHSLSRTVFDPVLRLAGLRVGGSDVILDSEPALECGRPRLVG